MEVIYTPGGEKQFALIDNSGKVVKRSNRRRELVEQMERAGTKPKPRKPKK